MTTYAVVRTSDMSPVTPIAPVEHRPDVVNDFRRRYGGERGLELVGEIDASPCGRLLAAASLRDAADAADTDARRADDEAVLHSLTALSVNGAEAERRRRAAARAARRADGERERAYFYRLQADAIMDALTPRRAW